MICKNCGNFNEDNSTYCIVCGAELTAEAAPAAGAAGQPGGMAAMLPSIDFLGLTPLNLCTPYLFPIK